LAWRRKQGGSRKSLERSLGLAGMKLDEAVPLIAEMLSLPIPEKYPLRCLRPIRGPSRLLASLPIWVLNIARLRPVVIATEDLP
jgi:hypothetical protein